MMGSGRLNDHKKRGGRSKYSPFTRAFLPTLTNNEFVQSKIFRSKNLIIFFQIHCRFRNVCSSHFCGGVKLFHVHNFNPLYCKRYFMHLLQNPFCSKSQNLQKNIPGQPTFVVLQIQIFVRTIEFGKFESIKRRQALNGL